MQSSKSKYLKFESSINSQLLVCFEPFCELVMIKPDHTLLVPIIGDLNEVSITLRDGEITIWDVSEALEVNKSIQISKKADREKKKAKNP
jgi:hypothetical protein